MKPTTASAFVFCALLATSSCVFGGDESDPLTVSDLRGLAKANLSATSCPLDLGVQKAAKSADIKGDVVDGEVEVTVSTQEQPSADLLQAQQTTGLSPLEAMAGTLIRCAFSVGSSEIRVSVFAAPADRDSVVTSGTPALSAGGESAGATFKSLQKLGEGDVLVANDASRAVGILRTDGPGAGTLTVGGEGLSSSSLKVLTSEFLKSVRAR